MSDTAAAAKRCTLCNEIKSLDQFSPHKKGKLGRASRCKACAVRLTYERGGKITVVEKRCAHCGELKEASVFYKAKASSDGLASRCRPCYELTPGRDIKARQAERAAIAARSGRTYRTSSMIAADRGRRLADEEKRRIDRTLAMAEARIRRQLREKVKNQIKKQRRMGNMAWRMRDCLNHDRWSPTILKRLGYTVADLKAHLERQFTKGMDWPAFQRGDIHIDHIVPVRCFDLTDQADVLACWALTNLRPLWAGDNLNKGGERLHLL